MSTSTAFLALQGSHDEFTEVGIIVLTDGEIETVKIYYANDVTFYVKNLTRVMSMLFPPDAATRTMKDIELHVQTLLIAHQVSKIFTNTNEGKFFVEQISLPPIDIEVKNVPAPEDRLLNSTYQMVRLLQLSGSSIGGMACPYHTHFPLVDDSAVQHFGPECMLFHAVALMFEFIKFS